jgi:hypothetical protein
MFSHIKELFSRPSGYTIARSVRLRSSASAYFNRTPASAGNQQKFTWSGWIKRGLLTSGYMCLFAARTGSSGTYAIFWIYNDTLSFQTSSATSNITTSAVYRDPSAWYHIVLSVDTTQATAANRTILYVNGTQVTSFSTATYPTQNSNLNINSTANHYIGQQNSSEYFDGYLTEINFIDGQALTPSSFGSTNATTGVWQPAKYTGTYGTNGFYLNFSSNGSSAALGTDFSGNSNTWTVNNISVTAGSTYDSMMDSPTVSATSSNYAVLNPVSGSVGSATISNGNLYSSVPATSAYGGGKSTIGITQSSGKWYFEVTATSFVNSGSVWMIIGLTKDANLLSSYQGQTAGSLVYAMKYNTTGGQICNEATAVRTDAGIQFAQGDVLQCAFDSATGKLWFGKNNFYFDSGSGTTGNPSAGTNQSLTTTITDNLFPFVQGFSSGGATAPSINFGQQPFTYTPPTGFVALNTYNLPAGSITTSGSFTGNASTDGPFVYLNGVPTTMTINGNAVTFGTNADHLANGFKVRSSSSSYNASGSNTYSVSVTGDKFKNAIAQTNP